MSVKTTHHGGCLPSDPFDLAYGSIGPLRGRFRLRRWVTSDRDHLEDFKSAQERLSARQQDPSKLDDSDVSPTSPGYALPGEPTTMAPYFLRVRRRFPGREMRNGLLCR